MSENRQNHDFQNSNDSLHNLDHSDLNSSGEIAMLSVVVNDAMMGIDISKRYPSFYKKLLEDSSLQQAFLDALDMMEMSKNNSLAALPGAACTNLAFLELAPWQPKINDLGKNNWQIRWHRTIKQLQAIFFPSELGLTYRSNPINLDESWFTLLRGDVLLRGNTYSWHLECGITEELEDALAAYLHLAVTFETKQVPLSNPLQASLTWGSYKETVDIPEQGRVRFPDIPLIAALDEQKENIIADLNLTIAAIPRVQGDESRR